MIKVRDCSEIVTKNLNHLFRNKEPWQVVAITTTTVLSLMWMWSVLSEDEGLCSRARKKIFRLARKVPYIKTRVDKEMQKLKNSFEEDIVENIGDIAYVTELPTNALTNDKILRMVEEHLNLGHYNWREGRVSGAVYYFEPKLVELISNVYSAASYTNPLHADIFPGICKMEAEVVRISANLFNGGTNSCGTMTTGGTESIIMACKAYRDYAREIKGITRPNLIAPKTAHAAFDKAGQYLGIYVKYIEIDPETTEANIDAMRKAINSNTIMLVGSAPNFPYGTMDDIEEIAKLGKKYNIPVHVDACLGGFLLAFMRRAGYQIKKFDFSINGVTTISVDTHKYGFAPKGSSVILYSHNKYRHYQYTITTEWPGGVYGSPTVNGSRAGGIIVACWATLLSFGQEGYVEATKRIIDTTRYLETCLRKIKGIFIYGKPATSVIAIGSNDIDIFKLSDALCSLGWNLNALQFPSGIHICVTHMHTSNGVAEKLIADIATSMEHLLSTSSEKLEGKMAIYGVAQSVPDRALVGDLVRYFLDSVYYTPMKK